MDGFGLRGSGFRSTSLKGIFGAFASALIACGGAGESREESEAWSLGSQRWHRRTRGGANVRDGITIDTERRLRSRSPQAASHRPFEFRIG
jgi:hypothetical protein